MDWKEKPSGWFAVFLNVAKVPMPSAVMARAARKRNCRSGDSEPSAAAAVRRKPPWSQPVEVSGPEPVRSHWSMGLGCGRLVPLMRSFEVTETPFWDSGHWWETTAAGWSWRFSPTPGRSESTSRPCFWSWALGPMPESMRSCGECRAPATRSTSPPGARRATCSRPPAEKSTPVATGPAAPASSKRTLRAAAAVSTRSRRPASARAGASSAEAAEQRAPFRSETVKRPMPCCSRAQLLKSSLLGRPICLQASRKRFESGFW
mmetsp:Transcript_71201/g.230493  ORF Transcript_71201/g.230493 Transcript_71201/m.230493 type:complete len:262 (+) Transcript_71201:1031-1816(+)